jgi:hypothetical protein
MSKGVISMDYEYFLSRPSVPESVSLWQFYQARAHLLDSGADVTLESIADLCEVSLEDITAVWGISTQYEEQYGQVQF